MTDPKETRKSIRQWITRNYRQVITGTKSIDKEEFFNKVDTLANIECDIDEDDKSEDYYKKIKEMVSVIEEKESASKQPTQQRLNTAETQMSQFDGSAMSFPQFEALFDCKFDATYNIADRFMAFYNLVGNEPRKYLSGLRPDVDGFKEARRRMREVYGNASKIVEEIEAKLRKTKAITNLERVADLQDLLNTVVDAVSALTNIGMSNQYLNETLFGSITSKLPRSIIVSYYTQHKSNKIEKLIEVVRNEISLQTLANLQCKPVVNSAKTTQISTFGGQERNVSELKCLICGAGHRSISCDAFDAETRRAKAKGARLCFRCLRQGHMSRECRSKFVCQCGQSHSSVICLAQTRAKQVVTNVPRVNMAVTYPEASKTDVCSFAASSNHDSNENCHVLAGNANRDINNLKTYYQTCLVKIGGQIVRVVLDSAGGRSVITEELCDELCLEVFASQTLNIGGPFGGSSTSSSTKIVCATLMSMVSEDSVPMMFSVVPSLGSLQMAVIPNDAREKLKQHGFDVADADETNYRHYPVKIIVGLDYYGSIWKGLETQVTKDLHVRESVFGWVAFGVTSNQDGENFEYINIMCAEPANHCVLANDANKQIEDYYLKHFVESKISRLMDGSYSVNLPWLYPIDLANNKQIAWTRFLRLLKQLRVRGLFDLYSETINEMTQNFGEKVDESAKVLLENYMPHHGVLRLDKITTQLRVVFDGSAHALGAKSLNDNLFKGINDWNSFKVFLDFRFGPSAVVADIEKAYLMIEVTPEDRDALRYFWLDESGNPTIYRMKVVPFGTSASPFLLFAVMKRHFDLHREEFADVIPRIESNFYVDDLLRALPTNDASQVRQFRNRVIELFARAKMNIRKWRTNIHELDREWSPGADQQVKTLGHIWNVHSDSITLAVDIDRLVKQHHLTKRTFSSFLSSIYDPFGMVSPYIICLRLFSRKLWQAKLKWDDPMPDEFRLEAESLMKNVHLVNSPSVPRNVVLESNGSKLIIFCDASIKAVGSVAYAQSTDQTQFILSKVKLAREATVPELELDALFMAADMALKITEAYAFESVTIYSDSLPNLQRLLKHPNSQKPSVAIRIAQLKKLISAKYRHVESKQNIADIITRGCLLPELIKNTKWWNGPPIATDTRFDETIISALMDAQECERSRTSVDQCHQFSKYEMAINTFNRIGVLIRILKYELLPNLNESELGLVLFLKYIQHQHFAIELDCVDTNRPLPPTSKLKNLNLFTDDVGLLRLHSRLDEAQFLSFDERNPIMLPPYCHLTQIIAVYAHTRCFHAGLDRTRETFRQRYFMTNCRRVLKSVIGRCRLCKIFRSKTVNPNFAPIPSFRLNYDDAPFTHTGLDITGPLKIKTSTQSAKYILIFTCTATRAVKLELLTGIEAADVFMAIRRFIARCGIPHVIYSDNGTNLLAVKKRLLKLIDDLKRCNDNFQHDIQWKQQTVYSPWRGGFFERLNRTVKFTLSTLTFKRTVGMDELTTIIVEIEAFMNSRPLFSTDGTTVTPAHFFIGKSLTHLPPIGNIDARNIPREDEMVNRFIISQRTLNALRTAYVQQYVLQLRQYHENSQQTNAVQYRIGDVVLVKNPNLAPYEWPLGRVTSVYNGTDGVIRTVTVKMISTNKRGNVRHDYQKRSVQTILPLECSSYTNDNVTSEGSPPRSMSHDGDSDD